LKTILEAITKKITLESKKRSNNLLRNGERKKLKIGKILEAKY